jgi:hypothetical protein
MTDEEIAKLGEQMWQLHRDETDPVLKEIFGLLHKQTVVLLRDLMMATLRDLSRALAKRRS